MMVDKRSKTITRAGAAFILTNFGLALVNLIIGILSGSLAIVSDAAHSLIDAASGFVVVIGEKIAGMKRYAARRAEIERGTAIVIAVIIIVMGGHIFYEAVEKILEPGEVEYSLPVMAILVASILAKLLLAMYLKRTGREIKSEVLMASAAESLNDTMISVAVLVSAVVYLIFRVDIEAYISMVIAVIIVKIGLELIWPKIFGRHHVHEGMPHTHTDV